jgi:hypothetical protein
VRMALAVAAVAVVVALLVVDAAEVGRDDGARRTTGTPSQKGPKVGIDVAAGVRFSLDGRTLTASLLTWAPSETAQRIASARIRATCGVAFAQVGPEGDPRNAREQRTGFWPAGRDTMRFRFAHDISPDARWCRVEDPAVGNVAFVKFGAAPVGSLSPEQRIERMGNEWARLFASDPSACNYMVQPACERMTCERVGHMKIHNCTPPSPIFRESFRNARVVDVAIDRKFAGVRFSNGETVRFIHVEGSTPDGVWWIDKFGGDAGRKLLEQAGGWVEGVAQSLGLRVAGSSRRWPSALEISSRSAPSSAANAARPFFVADSQVRGRRLSKAFSTWTSPASSRTWMCRERLPSERSSVSRT